MRGFAATILWGRRSLRETTLFQAVFPVPQALHYFSKASPSFHYGIRFISRYPKATSNEVISACFMGTRTNFQPRLFSAFTCRRRSLISKSIRIRVQSVQDGHGSSLIHIFPLGPIPQI